VITITGKAHDPTLFSSPEDFGLRRCHGSLRGQNEGIIEGQQESIFRTHQPFDPSVAGDPSETLKWKAKSPKSVRR